jgi:hypothetical protein
MACRLSTLLQKLSQLHRCSKRQHGKCDEHFCHTAATVTEAVTMSEIENQFNYENYD